jgi:hypothetical protein
VEVHEGPGKEDLDEEVPGPLPEAHPISQSGHETETEFN